MNLRHMLFVSACALGITGCEGAAWDRTAVPPPAIASASRAKWQQYCTFYGASDLAEINEMLRRQGEAGWELLTVGGKTGTVYCFKARAD